MSEAGITPIRHEDLNDQVYNVVFEWLMTGKLRPNERFSLSQLAQDLDVSRSPVHQALTRLVSENLVEVLPKRGYYVIPITRKVVLDAYDVRLALELLAAELTVGKLSEEELAELRRLMEATLPMIDEDRFVDMPAFTIANKRFHDYQVRLTDNEIMSRYYRRLKVNLLMERILYKRDMRVGTIVVEHRDLVEGFETGNLQRVSEAIRTHIETGKRLALEAIERAGGVL